LKKTIPLPKVVSHPRKHDSAPAGSFVFFEKSTGVAQFQADASADSPSTFERMASLLAMQCLMRGCEPGDYAVLVPADRALATRVTSRAKELLAESLALANPVSLSPRQKEILRAVICNLANKEIADKLNITVRTVKFHISSLLNKFGVDNRAELARRATGLMRSAAPFGDAAEPDVPLEPSRRLELGPVPVESRRDVPAKSRNLRFAQRVLSA
jgi:DNA-binding CsgD family transcriptional regulator